MVSYMHRRRTTIALIIFHAFLFVAFFQPKIGFAASNRVNIGYHPAMCLAAIYIAMDKNLFQKAGIEAKIIEYQGGPPMIPAFQKAEIDIGFLGGPPAISAMDKGIDLSIYGFAHMEGSAIIVRKDSPYQEVKDLKGKLIAVPVFGSVQDVLTRITLKVHGLNPVRDVRLMEAGELGGVGQLPTLLKRGDVDAFVAWPPFNEIPLTKGYGRAILTPERMVPFNPCCVIAARNPFVQENPELFKKIMAITIDASIFTVAYPDESAKSIRNVTGYDEDLTKASLQFAGNYCVLPTPEAVRATMDILREMRSLGYIKNELAQDRVFKLDHVKSIYPDVPLPPNKMGPQPEVYKRVTGRNPE